MKASQEKQVTVQRQGFFNLFLRDATGISFDLSSSAEFLQRKPTPNHTQETYAGQNLRIVTNDKCPNIFILKWEISAKKSGVAKMCMSEIADSFPAHLHCRHPAKTENVPTQASPFGGIPANNWECYP